jgi:Outer membrane protein beta-barrel domain
MKKVLLSIIVMICINSVSFSQVRFGVRGGLNLASQNSNIGGLAISSGTLVSFHAGLVLDAPLTETISIQPALLFSVKGSGEASSTSGSVTTSSKKVSFNYLEVPIDVLYNFNESFSVGAGPYLGYLLSTSPATTSTDGVKKVDYGLNVVLNYTIIDGLQIGARYSLGMGNLVDTAALSGSGISFGDVSIKNNVIGFSVTKFFGGGE